MRQEGQGAVEIAGPEMVVLQRTGEGERLAVRSDGGKRAGRGDECIPVDAARPPVESHLGRK